MPADENPYDVVMRTKPFRVVPGGSAKCTSIPHDGTFFFPLRVIVPDEVASNFFITDFKVGRDSQLCSVGALPAELFAASGPGFEFLFDPIYAGYVVAMDVQSTCDVEAEFSAQVMGRWALFRSNVRKICLGLGSTNVAAEGAVNVSVEPQRAFRPTHLFLPSDVVSHFEVQTVFQVARRGRTEHVVESIPDLAERGRALGIDSSKAAGSRLIPIHLRPSETVEVGRCLTVSAVNRGGQARQFKAAIVGDPV